MLSASIRPDIVEHLEKYCASKGVDCDHARRVLSSPKQPKSAFIGRILKTNILPPCTNTVVFSLSQYVNPPKDRLDYTQSDEEEESKTTVVASSQLSEDDASSSDDSEAPFSSVVYQVGDRVDGFYQGFSGPQKFFPGRITAVHSDGEYDIEYDDGDKETHVAAGFIRYYEDDDDEKADNRAGNEEHDKSSVSGTLCDESELARIVRAQIGWIVWY